MVTWEGIALALGVAAVVAAGEALHARRVRALKRLAFGPEASARPWTRGVPVARAVAAACAAWGLWQLWTGPSQSRRPLSVPEGGYRHLVLVLDVSPSMQLRDAGPDGQQTRMRRAHDLLMSFFQRVAVDQARISVVAFYNGAKPVVIDTRDLEVARNILDDLPLDQAFEIGKTRIFDGLQLAADIARPWKAGSAALVLVSDGDTVPDQGMPEMPESIAETLVIGVGDSRAGKFIDGHQSRQDAFTLRQIASRLGGLYHDGNQQHIPSKFLARLAEVAPLARPESARLRQAALVAVGAGSAVLALTPLALALFGSGWQGARRSAKPRALSSGHRGEGRSLALAGEETGART